MRWISLLLIVFLYGCFKKEEYPQMCFLERNAYHQVGDTIHLTFCYGLDQYNGTVSNVHWIIVNEENEIVFENRNQNTYYIISDSGYFRLSSNGFNDHEIPPLDSEVIYPSFKTHSYITVYTNDDNFNTSYEITLKDKWDNIMGIDTVSSYDPNSSDECYFNSDNANFEINSAQEYYLFGQDINTPTQTWQDTLVVYGSDVYCKKVELEF